MNPPTSPAAARRQRRSPRALLAGVLALLTTAAVTWAQPAAPLLPPGGPRVKIFVLTGQSNSLGTTADKKEPDITPGTDPLDAQIPFFWANRSTRAGDGPTALYDDSGGKIVTLRARRRGRGPVVLGAGDWVLPASGGGGEKNFLFVKASRGGGGNSFWLKDHTDDHVYRHVVDTVRRAVQALPDGVTFELAALLYVQGESDSAAEAAASGERLRRLATNLRQDLPNAAAMRVIIGGIASGGKNGDVVRAQQSALPAADPTFRYLDTLDLRPQRYDNLHFSKGAKLELGRRMAKAWLDWPR